MINLLCNITWEQIGIIATALIGLSGLIVSLFSITENIKESKRNRLQKSILELEACLNNYYKHISINIISSEFSKLGKLVLIRKGTKEYSEKILDMRDVILNKAEDLQIHHFEMVQVIEQLRKVKSEENYKLLFGFLNNCYSKAQIFFKTYETVLMSVKNKGSINQEANEKKLFDLEIDLENMYIANGVFLRLKQILITKLRNISIADARISLFYRDKELLLGQVFEELKKHGILVSNVKNLETAIIKVNDKFTQLGMLKNRSKLLVESIRTSFFNKEKENINETK